MKKFLPVVFVLFFSLGGYPQNSNQEKIIDWHGYTKLRFTTDFNDNYNFSLRMLKFWINSRPGFSEHWSFKAQLMFSSFLKDKFILQDVWGQYKWNSSSIRFGQFIPRFSLQRFQPDYLISHGDRAMSVNLLIPDGTLGVRDIGVQYNLKAVDNNLSFNVGVFNGFGIVKYKFNNQGFLVTHNLSYRINFKSSFLNSGYSVMYRKADNIVFRGILPDTVVYSGNDFRYNINVMFSSKHLDIQGEYLKAFLDDYSAYGYYLLTTYKFNNKHNVYFLYDYYETDAFNTTFKPWYYIGYNYFIKSYKLMVKVETGFNEYSNKIRNKTTLQVQIFFH